MKYILLISLLFTVNCTTYLQSLTNIRTIEGTPYSRAQEVANMRFNDMIGPSMRPSEEFMDKPQVDPDLVIIVPQSEALLIGFPGL